MTITEAIEQQRHPRGAWMLDALQRGEILETQAWYLLTVVPCSAPYDPRCPRCAEFDEAVRVGCEHTARMLTAPSPELFFARLTQ